ncbi:MAG: TetR/AcrR family transcriptional regulator [Acidimicrobiales bacterium]|jgi:AcrR family transcriptional regulator
MTLEPLTPERRRQQTRDHLLQAAAEVFAARGFHGASLDEVAAKAGFTKGAVYSNFKNKEELFLALLEAIQQREMDALHTTIQASEIPPEARLSDFVNLIRDQTQDLGANWDILYQEFTLYALRNPAAREKLAAFDAMTIRSVSDLIESERSRQSIGTLEHPEHVARIVVALFRGIGLMRALDAALVDASFLETAMAFLARGLMTAETPSPL